MAQLAEHRTVKQFQAREATSNGSTRPQTLDRDWLRQVCVEAGADDVGFVEIERPEIADQKADILWLLPKTKTLISFVVRMNRKNIRTPARSIANLEFRHTTDETNEVARKIAVALERIGVRAMNGGAAGFPMEADRLGALREEKNLSQGDIEKRTGLLRCYISRVENGHTVPTVETLEKMARALEVPLYRLFYDGEAPPKLENLPKRKTGDEIAWGSSGKDARFLSNLRRFLGRAQDRDRKLLLSFAQKLASKRNGRKSMAA